MSKSMFISFHYTSRFGQTYDTGYSNIILPCTDIPSEQIELELLTDLLTKEYVEMNKLDSASLTILNFREV